MEPLALQVRHGDEKTIECWDDDGDLQWYEDIQLRTVSSATSVTNSSIRRSGHRDSISSRLSARSDLDSNVGGDEDWQVQLHDNDEDILSEEAIASAKNAGIPLPANVPKSALIGGTIKRLGRRKPKKSIVDDWSEDVELPDPDSILELKGNQNTVSPETLRQVSSTATSPVKTSASPFWDDDISARLQSAFANFDRFRDDDDDHDHDVFDDEDVPTIKVAKSRSPQKTNIISDSKPEKSTTEVENFEDDFELPADDIPLRLSPRKIVARTSSPTPEDFDVDWSEGSIGVRFGGTMRDHRSNPSSTVSVLSPSASSCLTGESEDEGLDGLVIPEGPLDLESSLKKRQDPKSTRVADNSVLVQAGYEPTSTDDFLSGLDVEDYDAFNPKKLSLNPNVKYKTERPSTPARRSTTSITFTNTTISPKSPKTRIPRLSGHDRPHSTHLETVSESGALSKFRRSQSRVRGHASQASVSSLPSLSTSTSPTPQTPGRLLVGTRVPKVSMTGEHVTPGKQLLKKRSMPTMRNVQQTAWTLSFQSSPSRQLGLVRPFVSTIRPKTPVDRIGNDTKTLMRRSQTPFLPAGASESQSQHAKVKIYRHSRHTKSDSSSDMFNSQIPVPRSSRLSRPDIFANNSGESSPENLRTATKRTVTRPARRRNFGDGTELESFDDLPTSSTAESKYIKNPAGRGVPRSLRSRLGQSQPLPSREENSMQSPTDTAFKHHDTTPRFARDTNASRNAREQRIASLNFSPKGRESNPLGSLSSNWKTQTISRVPSSSASIRSKKSRPASVPGGKPFLIKPMGTGVQEPKSVNGMHYNPDAYRWEGNENLIHEFDTTSPKASKPAPALITNVGAMQNVQVVGGMVFDPQRMCWLKLAPLQPGTNGQVAIQDEDDVFAGLDDLNEKSQYRIPGGRSSGVHDDPGRAPSGDEKSWGESSDEWPITEEFDVGPEFIRRQRAEEEKWRRKVDKWVSFDRGKFGDGWRWAIRDLVRFNNAIGAQELESIW